MEYQKQDKFIIGIDSGGTSTRIRIKNITKKSQRDMVYLPSHYTTIGAEKFSNEIYKDIKHFTGILNLDMRNCTGIAIGGAGLRNPEQKAEVELLLKRKSKVKKIIIESDAYIALYDAYKDKDGIIIICGTGAVLYARYKGKIERVGGWGRTFTDPGSGNYLGVIALHTIALEYDVYDGLFQSDFSKIVESVFEITGENMTEKLYRDNFKPSELVPLILELAYEGNKIAKSLIDKTIDELVFFLKIFIGKKPKKVQFNLSLSGSILTGENVFSGKFKNIIETTFKKEIKLTGIKVNPLRGALKLIESAI